ncbi:hypothetical protein QN363_19365 [Undibacterium sp. CCC2.1]|nr:MULTISPECIES: hypothetical protein [unclassified Undibacterium]MEB0141185.1 hypothetical protein [Undibacterium sp. CCC2.1]MEB0174232.1 hypothetical protein [Undibacterium sp. CCC1.1]MEB0178175.1 hypothetical protein [Undibacterium sp. CCC3.4]MEB0217377.1 hypothetical protein [Undibacterium sp. 5I2]
MPYPFIYCNVSSSSFPAIGAALQPMAAPIVQNFLSAANVSTSAAEVTSLPLAPMATPRPDIQSLLMSGPAPNIEAQATTLGPEQLARANVTRVWLERERAKNYAQYLYLDAKNPPPRSVLARQALHYYYLSIPLEPCTRQDLASSLRYINAFEGRCRSLHASGYGQERIRKLHDAVRTYYAKQLMQSGPEASAAAAVYGEAFFEYEQVVRKNPQLYRGIARLYCDALFVELEATRPHTQLELDAAESKLRKLSMVFTAFGETDLVPRLRVLSEAICRHYAHACSLANYRSEVARLRAIYVELTEQSHDTPDAKETFFRAGLLYAHALLKESIAASSNSDERTVFEQELALLKRELQVSRPDLLQLYPELQAEIDSVGLSW